MSQVKRRKIVLVVYSLGMGGAEKVVSDLSFEFAKRHDVTLVLFDGQRRYYPYAGELLDFACPSRDAWWEKLWTFGLRTWRLYRLFQQRRFDTIISVMEHANFPSILASRQTLAANHCNPERNFSRLDWWFASWLYPKARRLVTVSQQGKQIFEQRLGLTNVTCLYNPLDLRRIHALAKEPPVMAMDGAYMVAAGRLSPEKDFSSLLGAYAASQARQQFKLVLLGEGEERPALEAKVRALGLEGRVWLPGFVSNPYPYFAQARCLVLSSLHEAFPLVLLEALALGCPVVATDCPTGPAEIVKPKQNGLLVPLGDVAALAQGMDALCLDDALHRQCQAHAPASVAHLDISKVAEQWLAL